MPSTNEGFPNAPLPLQNLRSNAGMTQSNAPDLPPSADANKENMMVSTLPSSSLVLKNNEKTPNPPSDLMLSATTTIPLLSLTGTIAHPKERRPHHQQVDSTKVVTMENNANAGASCEDLNDACEESKTKELPELKIITTKSDHEEGTKKGLPKEEEEEQQNDVDIMGAEVSADELQKNGDATQGQKRPTNKRLCVFSILMLLFQEETRSEGTKGKNIIKRHAKRRLRASLMSKISQEKRIHREEKT